MSGAPIPWHQTITAPARGEARCRSGTGGWRRTGLWGLDVFDLLDSPEALGPLVLIWHLRHHPEVVANEKVSDQLAVDPHRSLRAGRQDRANLARWCSSTPVVDAVPRHTAREVAMAEDQRR